MTPFCARQAGLAAVLAAVLLPACEEIRLQVIYTGPGDAGTPADAQVPSLGVSGFALDWATPRSLRWRWTLAGDPPQVGFMELCVARSQAEALQRTGSARVFGQADNPELGGGYLNPGRDPVQATITDRLEPATAYWAVLTVVTVAGARLVTEPASGTTLAEPSQELVVFRDQAPKGYPLPLDTFALGSTHPFSGTADFEYVPSCTEPAGCFENLRFKEVALSTSAIPRASFEDGSAFLELELENCGQPSLWAVLRLWPGDCSPELSTFNPITVSGGCGYRLIQVPLRTFQPLPYESFAQGLCEVGIGATWTANQRVLVDEVRVRW